MRKGLTILLLGCSLLSMALVPPRDPADWAEWQARINAQRESEMQHTGKAYAAAATQANHVPTIIPRVPVIMASFADYELHSAVAEVDSLFNGQNWTQDGATGSVRQYFYDQSMGKYSPQFDIIGPITLSKGYASYGSGSDGGLMVKEACQLVDGFVDFSQYDQNNDGYVDLVFVFYAGFGENDKRYIPKELIPDPSKLVWPQYMSNCDGGKYDGKTVKYCEYTNELDGFLSDQNTLIKAGIGVPCHEFSHALGLPDLYSTNATKNHKLLGAWDIMCNGPYNNDAHTPPSYSAYERFFMGWLTPTLITEPDTLTLAYIATANQAYLISENDKHNLNGVNPDTTVFYLLENRQQVGWDIGIKGSGLLLTRINYMPSLWTSNTINNNPDNLGVDLIEADGQFPDINTDEGYFGKPGELFPEGATEYLGITDHSITNITMNDGIIRFVYRGGKQPTDSHPASVIPAEGQQTFKTIQDGQLLIHSNGRVYSIYGEEIRTY